MKNDDQLADEMAEEATQFANSIADTVAVLMIKSKFNALDRKSTRLNSSHIPLSRMPSSA